MTLAEPKGFWSYARHDGDHSAGRMDELHALISHELGSQLALAGPVDIFLDKSAIHTGEEWEKMIEERLAESTFLIAILTPNFLSRPWCCREIMLFREREATLKRSNLIFPIEYMDIADMRGPLKDRVADPKVLKLLDSRQIKGFRRHRRIDPRLPVVGDFVEDLCGEIKNRLLGLDPRLDPRTEPAPVTEPIANTRPIAVAVPPRLPHPVAGTVIREGPGPQMVLIPAGTFLMGAPEAESKREGRKDAEARPQHQVTIARPFWLGKYPVTRGEYAVFAAETGRGDGEWRKTSFPQNDRHPVVNVSNGDALAYLAWLSDKTGQTYRLPSEAEWEYAARAGTTTARYWGDAAGKPGEHAQFSRDFGSSGGTCPAASFKRNAFGLYDMLGNVWEWTADCWHDDYHSAPDDGSAWDADDAVRRVIRGGSWLDPAADARSACRGRCDSSGRDGHLGFRCARVQSASEA